jgi:Filamin/ABP280 repeat
MASSAPKPIWVRQAEEAKQKSDAATTAAAKAAFEATFNSSAAAKPELDTIPEPNSDSDDTPSLPSSPQSVGPVDPSRSIAAGPGVAGGAAGTAVSFTVTLKDSHGSKIPHGGTIVKAKVSPGPGVGGSDLDSIVKDLNDGTYTVTYLVPKRGNYNVNVLVDDRPIMGSPFPVFFSTGPTTTTTTATLTSTTTLGTMGTIGTTSVPMYGMMNQTMPNMPNYMVGTGLGMMATGNSGGVILQGVGASLGEVCREYLYGKCAKVPGECRFGHPPQQLLMHVLATAATTMNGTLMGPSAAAMAAAQAIVAAQALQAHAAQMKSQKPEERDAAGSGALICFLSLFVFLGFLS